MVIKHHLELATVPSGKNAGISRLACVNEMKLHVATNTGSPDTRENVMCFNSLLSLIQLSPTLHQISHLSCFL